MVQARYYPGTREISYTFLSSSQQLQERGAQVEALQEQLLEAAHGMESLSSQLQQSSARTDASGAGTALLQVSGDQILRGAIYVFL